MYHVLEVEYALTLQPDDDVASEKVRSSTYLVIVIIINIMLLWKIMRVVVEGNIVMRLEMCVCVCVFKFGCTIVRTCQCFV